MPLGLLLLATPSLAQAPKTPPLQGNGIFPSLPVIAKGADSDTETGIGARGPWADTLWAIGHVAHLRGDGIGLQGIGRYLASANLHVLHPVRGTQRRCIHAAKITAQFVYS